MFINVPITATGFAIMDDTQKFDKLNNHASSVLFFFTKKGLFVTLPQSIKIRPTAHKFMPLWDQKLTLRNHTAGIKRILFLCKFEPLRSGGNNIPMQLP